MVKKPLNILLGKGASSDHNTFSAIPGLILTDLKMPAHGCKSEC